MIEQLKKRERIVWVDCAKAIGMFFIVLGHTFPTRLNPYIYSFSVPLFFFLSGYLCPNEKLPIKVAFKKIVRGLFIPMVSLWIFNLLINSFSNPSILWNTNNYFDAICGKQTSLGTLWFVYDLILVKLFFLISSRILRLVYLLFSLAIVVILDYQDIHLSQAIVTIWGCYVFLWIGAVVRKYQNCLPVLVRKYRLLVSLLLSIFLFVIVKEPLYMYIAEYNNNVFLSIFFAVVGIASICLFSSSFKKNSK